MIHSLNGGGAERVMAGLCSRLQARGHEVTLITLDDALHDRHAVADAVVRVPLGIMIASRGLRSAIGNNIWRLRRIRSAIKQSNPNVVLSFCDVINALVLMATLGQSTAVVVSERSDPAQQKLSMPWSRLRPWLYRRAAAVVVLSPTVATFVAPWCRDQPIVIPSATEEPPQINLHCDSPVNNCYLIGVGRLENEKGFDRLITAFAALATKHSQWRLRIYGEGSQRESLQQLASAHGVADRVELPGWISPIWPAFDNADLFALTSRYEGLPSALLEAMAAGVACVAVDCESGPRAIVQHDVDGWLVENDDAAIQTGLDRCMSDADLRTRLGQAGRQVTKRFGWQVMVDAYEKVLIEHSINGIKP